MKWQECINEIRKQHARFDQNISTWIEGYRLPGGTIFCGKGCRHCCNLAVNATFTEALCIAESLTDEQSRRVHNHATRLLEEIGNVHDLVSYLRMHREKLGFCPFLDDDGGCSIYASRPFSCRSLLSTKEPVWCGQDFGELTPADKRAFMESLDRSIVAFPMHYVAATQEMGQDFELGSAQGMAERFGFSVYGNLPFLVFLQLELNLRDEVPKGYDATVSLLENRGYNSGFLVMLERY